VAKILICVNTVATTFQVMTAIHKPKKYSQHITS